MPFDREEFDRSDPELLQEGRWGNAVLYLFRRGEEAWVVKDFRPCPGIVRQTWGAYMAGRELSALRKLDGIPGFPQDAFRLDRFAIAYRYIAGTDIGEADQALLTPVFFEALDSLVSKMHACGVAHLDIRTGSNVLVTERGNPLILDFQSHLGLEGLPAFLRRFLVAVDRSGVYKHWARRSPESLGKERAEFLERFNGLRKFWILKGYLGVKAGKGREGA
ncbi:MAG: hypothetical protein AB1346_08270 [Thermodesulfobacteriota bacterium]